MRGKSTSRATCAQRFKTVALLFSLALTWLASAALAAAGPPPRVCQRFDEDWRFAKGDPAGASAAAFDDSSWRRLDLPHDWSIEDLPPRPAGQRSTAALATARSGPFDPQAEGDGAVGFTVAGLGWYRKSFVLPAAWRGRRVSLTFDGVYMNCQVWCNGQRVAEHPYGYTSFHVDLTAQARWGAANVLAVRVDASGRTSRWYPGAGIYRHVWLTATDPLHVAPWGVFVTTPKVTPQEATVHVRTTLRNDGGQQRAVTLESRLLDPHGKSVASIAAQRTIEPAATLIVDQDLAAPRPVLWSPDSPALYRVASSLAATGKDLDAVETTFGIRTIEVDAEKGLRINGRSIKLRGGCVHHDNGCLGSCTLDRAEQRRVELLKAAGFNAIRTSHNPPSPAFLEACDRLGMFVMDEAFDCWMRGKNGQDYGRFFTAWWRRDIESMVLRDRNHPSIIFWSIGNEIPGQDKPEGAKYSKEISDDVRRLDPTRPVTQAFMPIGNWDDLFPAFDALDVCGYNYKEDRYRQDHAKRPRQVIVCTESMPRGCFQHWMSVLDLPYVIGDFVWTGYDYLGEAAIGRTRWDGETTAGSETWPWTVAYCGDLDSLWLPAAAVLLPRGRLGGPPHRLLLRPAAHSARQDVGRGLGLGLDRRAGLVDLAGPGGQAASDPGLLVLPARPAHAQRQGPGGQGHRSPHAFHGRLEVAL